MKLKIDNASYVDLVGNRRTIAYAINDNVSTTRHTRRNIGGGKTEKAKRDTPHEYESRYELMNAFMIASKSKRISVVADLANTSPIRCKVENIRHKAVGETLFILELAPIGEKKGERQVSK